MLAGPTKTVVVVLRGWNWILFAGGGQAQWWCCCALALLSVSFNDIERNLNDPISATERREKEKKRRQLNKIIVHGDLPFRGHFSHATLLLVLQPDDYRFGVLRARRPLRKQLLSERRGEWREKMARNFFFGEGGRGNVMQSIHFCQPARSNIFFHYCENEFIVRKSIIPKVLLHSFCILLCALSPRMAQRKSFSFASPLNL